MNKMMKMTVIAICGAFLSSAAMAQSALQQLKFQAGDDAVAASAEIPTVHTAVLPGGGLVTLPLNAKDVFTQCQAVDSKAMSLVAWTLPQAVGVMQHCLDKSYSEEGRGYTVTAKAAKFFVPLCAPAPGRMACQAMTEVDGIQITVEGQILTGDSVLMDLNFSLKQRDGKILGFRAAVDNQAAILK